MKKFYIITIFPESFDSYLNSSILRRAKEKEFVKINFLNPRDFAENRHKTVDDKAYGGGPGMVLKTEPILKAVSSVLKSKVSRRAGSRFAGKSQKTKIILFSARGKQFTSKMARNYAKKCEDFILISGRYEGTDERVKKILKAEEISIGPYILTGGELPAMIFIDSVSRHIPGTLGKQESLEEIKGSYPVYSRPEIIKWKGKKYGVPKVLLSGNHKKIEEWRAKHGKFLN